MSRTPARREHCFAPILGLILLTLGAAELQAQCQLTWQPGTPIQAPSGRVMTLCNTAAGELVVGGRFLEAGPQIVNRIARWDGAAWHALGVGVDDQVNAVVQLPNGDLIAAGKFLHAGGVAANHVARWDGSTWSPLGPGLDGDVVDLAVMPNGDVIAAGTFQASGTASTPLVARWNGSTWSQLGAGVPLTAVDQIELLANGDLAVVGDPWNGGQGGNELRRWNGAVWSNFPFAVFNVGAIAVAPNGDVAIAGQFGLTVGVAVWDGTNLTQLAGPPTFGLYYRNNGSLLGMTGGNGFVRQWNGSGWVQLGGLPGVPSAVLHERASGDLMVGGGGTGELAPFPRSLAGFDGIEWTRWEAVPQLHVDYAIAANGDLYGGGVTGSLADVQRWNGSQWHSIGPGVAGVVNSLAGLADGGLFAVGSFLSSTGIEFAMRWDGASWSSASTGIGNPVNAVIQSPDGTIYAAPDQSGSDAVRWFDGNQWLPVGTGMLGTAYALACLPNGDLLAGGYLFHGGSLTLDCMRWDGATWSSFGSPLSGRILSLLARDDGTVVAGGEQLLPTAGFPVVEFDGSAWSALGAPFDDRVTSLRAMPNGDVLATGTFENVGTTSVGRLARWNGVAWTGIGQGANAVVTASGLSRDGDLFVSGYFTRVGGQPSAALARASTSCPAAVASYGSGCVGPAGPVTLAAVDPPWGGAQFRTRANGIPANSLVVSLIGSAAAAVPLGPLVPQALSGCSLLTSSNLAELTAPSAGVAEPVVTIPPAAGLIGATFYQQVLAVQFDPAFNILTVSSSNGLAATIGFF